MIFDAEFDEGSPSAKIFGLLLLTSDETLEQDMRRLFPAGSTILHSARVQSADSVTAGSLATMSETITAAAAQLPAAPAYDVIAYGCTSGTAVIGSAEVARLVRAGRAGREVTTPLDALVAACRAGGLSRLALLSPYVAEVSDRLRDALAAAGIETPCFGTFAEAREERVARIAGSSIIAATEKLDLANDCDAFFLSCTNLPTLDVLEEIEARIGKPVLSSNQVLAWDMARRAGLSAMPRPIGWLHRRGFAGQGA